MTCLLFQEGRPESHGIRPHSLNVTTISTLTTEVIKGNANLSQLAIQGNYRAVTAMGMEKVYSRNLAHWEIFAARFARGDFQGNRNVESIATDPPEISSECQAGEISERRLPRAKTGRLGDSHSGNGKRRAS